MQESPIAVFKLKKTCKSKYAKYWKKDISRTEARSNFYSNYKHGINFENYLIDVKSFKHIQAFCKLRINAHCLEIEKGRYVRPYLSREQRICKFCLLNICDDKIHFLTQCNFHDAERVELFTKFIQLVKGKKNLNLKDKFSNLYGRPITENDS